MSPPETSYHIPKRPSTCPPRSPSSRSHPVPEPNPSDAAQCLDPPYPSRAYFHADIGDHHISLRFTNLPPLHIKALRPLIQYYWWPRKAHETVEYSTSATVFDLSVKSPKGWSTGTHDGYRAKRDFVRLQLEILRVLHSRGWKVRQTASYALQQPGWLTRFIHPRPDSHLFPLFRTSEKSDPHNWLLLSMHYHGELWFITSTPRKLKHTIVEQLRRSVSIFREQSCCYRILLEEPFEVALEVILDILADFKFTTFASIETWPPVIVLTCPQNPDEDPQTQRQRVG